jgi:hypothetical protein
MREIIPRKSDPANNLWLSQTCIPRNIWGPNSLPLDSWTFLCGPVNWIYKTIYAVRLRSCLSIIMQPNEKDDEVELLFTDPHFVHPHFGPLSDQITPSR